MVLSPKMCLHFLNLLPACWMTLLLDCNTIITNQPLEQYQTANHLLERIGSHYQAQPITHLAQVCFVYTFPFFICLAVSFTFHISISVFTSICLSFFL